ncbi:hypothetical protein ZWY2020_015818 [Hordeum vulgare]|nr:hypothetical protein ZWY2020_015818 [Hordeum vulgare]
MAGHGRKKAASPSQVMQGPDVQAPRYAIPPLAMGRPEAAAEAVAAEAWLAGHVAARSDSSLRVDWGNGVYPPGGFVNYLRNPSSVILPQEIPRQPAMSPDAHFVAPTLPSKKNPIRATKKRSKHAHVEIADDEEGEIMKRLPWTSEEDDRLVSPWLKNSNDSVGGNFKKNDKYWDDVVADFNSNTPSVAKDKSIKLLTDGIELTKC